MFFYQSCSFSNIIAWNKTWNYGKSIKLNIWALKGKIVIELMATHTYSSNFIMVLNIVLKPNLVGRSRAGIGLGWRKNRKRKNSVRRGWPGRLTWQDLVKNSVATRWLLFFLTKTTSFWFFKKKFDPGDLVTRSKPRTRVVDRAGHWARSKNYNPKVHFFILGWERNIAPPKNGVREREYLVLIVVI